MAAPVKGLYVAMTATLSVSSIALQPLADSTSNVLRAVSALTWPVIVVIAIIVFQAPLRAAIGRISEVDVGTTKVVLQNQADNAANTTKSLIGAPEGVSDSSSAIAAARTNAAKDPSNSVLSAWSGVEDAVRKAAQAAPGVSSPSVPEVVNKLVAESSLDSALVPVAKTLESLRAVAAIKPKAISPAMATSFVSAASDLARLIGKVA
jgi:hypothetical protein